MQPVVYKLDKERTLKINFRAIAKLEVLLGAKATKWDKTLEDISFGQTATILAEAMRHESSDITSDQVMDLIEEYSNPTEAKRNAYICLNEYFGKNNPPVAKEQAATSPVDQAALN